MFDDAKEDIHDAFALVADILGLTQLTPHAQTVAGSALAFWAVHVVVSPVLSAKLFPRSYGELRSARDRNNWHVHVVSFVHALASIPLAVRCLGIPSLNVDRAYGWDARAGTLFAVACGYFLWDIIESTFVHFSDIGFVVHAFSCFFIYLLSFKPFIAYYGPRFLLWELSTPFLNINWFLDKMGRTGSTLQLVNGIVLLTTFAGVRLVYGTIQSYAFFCTLYAIKDEIPLSVALVYGGGNIVLNGLNWVWFAKMVAALRKRMKPTKSLNSKNRSDLQSYGDGCINDDCGGVWDKPHPGIPGGSNDLRDHEKTE